MSTISEKAKAEGDLAEAEFPEEEVTLEEPETEPEPEAEPEPEPEPVEPDEAALAAQDRALSSEDTRHQKALGKAYGDAWPEHVRCALCDGVGFLNPELAMSLNNAQWEQLLQVAVMLVTDEYVQDPNYEMCPNCMGKTKTRSGAQDAEHYLKLCDVCSGNGYIGRQPKLPTLTPISPNGEATGPSMPVIPSYGAPGPDDAWGRPSGHSHYGIPPAMVNG